MILELNTLSNQPIYTQLRDQIVLAIASRQLQPGEMLPSVRRLAADLGVNLHTVNKAYSVLNDEGYIVMDRRRGAAVADLVKNSSHFIDGLERDLTLSAAEARCHNFSEYEFLELCRNCYRKTGAVQLYND